MEQSAEPAPISVPMMPGLHGGMLQRGSLKGLAPGGKGSIPAKVRKNLVRIAGKVQPRLLAYAMGEVEGQSHGDAIRAMEIAYRFGIGQQGPISMQAVEGFAAALWASTGQWADREGLTSDQLAGLRNEWQQIASSFAKQHRK